MNPNVPPIDPNTFAPEISQFVNGWTLLFCLGIFIVVSIIRRICEGSVKVLMTNFFWQEVVLPVLPSFLGVLAATLAKQFPYPGAIHTLSARIFYGLVCGFFSAWAYSIIKTLIKKFTGVDIDPNDLVTMKEQELADARAKLAKSNPPPAAPKAP